MQVKCILRYFRPSLSYHDLSDLVILCFVYFGVAILHGLYCMPIWIYASIQEPKRADESDEEEKTFRRRNLVSNWSRYGDLPEDNDEDLPLQRGDDFTKLLASAGIFNSSLASGNFCLLVAIANRLNQDQDRQNVGPDLHPSYLTL